MRVLDARRYGPGAYGFAGQEHRQTRGHRVVVDVRGHRDPAVTLRIDCEVSTDDGATWTYGGGFTVDGGPLVDREGQPLTEAVAIFGHEPHPDQAPCAHRLVRGTLTIVGGMLETSVDLDGVERL